MPAEPLGIRDPGERQLFGIVEMPLDFTIDEHVGRVNTGTDEVSVAHMRAPAGWSEPGQTPEFDEYTVVLAGTLRAGAGADAAA
mgnify:CR=1 FL=1